MSQDNITYSSCDFSDPQSIEARAKQLEGMTFREVLDLGISPEGVDRDYNSRSYKGGMGNLIEERFFGYRANSDQGPDFPEAGVELKATCYDVKKGGELSAGERLVLTMIPFDGPIEDDFCDSHAWEKSMNILLVYYERKRGLDPYDQRILYTTMFTPPEKDLKIIRNDYDKIVSIVKAGKAEELSESLTSYLGACTKGATAEKSVTSQFYPPHTPAKKRAFCFKRQYMDYVLHHYVIGEPMDAEAIIKDVSQLADKSFEDIVLERIIAHVGKTDRELCDMLGLEYTGSKAQWAQISYALLDVRGGKAEEFEKANVSVRTVRIESEGKVKESLSLGTFRFDELAKEKWEEAPLHNYFEETRFLFVSFQKSSSGTTLAGARFWSMPQSDIEGSLHDCWQQTKDVIASDVHLSPIRRKDGKIVVENNLPSMSDNLVAHVRPHTSHAAYILGDGTRIGDPERDAFPLPDGRMMTKQSFWLNNGYIYEIVKI